MNRFVIFCLLFLNLAGSGAFSQEVGQVVKRTVLTKKPLDTNQIVYDEKGNALHYHQYEKLLNTGGYNIVIDGSASDPNARHMLKRTTVKEQGQSYERIKKYLTIKSPSLQENNLLDIKPLTGIVPERELENKVIVLIFWNADCPPCTEGFAGINDFFKQISNPNDLIILAITGDPKAAAIAKLKEKPLLYAKLISDAHGILNAYELHSYPSYVVADKDRIIRYAVSGGSTVTIPSLKNAIQSVLMQ